MRACPSVCAAVVALVPTVAVAQPIHLTLAEVLARARTQSPDIVVAQARIDETRARLVGARVRLRDNPSLDASSGPRNSERGTSVDLDVGFTQLFETGDQRRARIAAAEAAVRGDTAAAADARRRALQDVAVAFFDAAYTEQRLQLLVAAQQMAADTLRIASRRYAAGDIAVLDVNLARSALARATSARIATEADRTLSNSSLARLIALPEGVTVVADGRLDDDRAADLDGLLAALELRPDLRAIEAGLDEAQAGARLGEALKRPDVGFTLRAKKEGADRAIVGGFTVALPVFNSGQEQRADGDARSARLRLELGLARSAAIRSVRALHAAYIARRAAAAAFEQDALPGAAENEQLSQRSFEEGQLSLADLLVVRRELVETRLDYLERLRDAAETAMMRDAAAGVLQ